MGSSKDDSKNKIKKVTIQDVEPMQCCFCFSTIWEEAEYNADTKIVTICDQCHTWDKKGKAHQILDS